METVAGRPGEREVFWSRAVGPIRCLPLIIRSSAQHFTQTLTEKLWDIHKIVLPKELHHGLNPNTPGNLFLIN
jgi:hypothetical protein